MRTRKNSVFGVFLRSNHNEDIIENLLSELFIKFYIGNDVTVNTIEISSEYPSILQIKEITNLFDCFLSKKFTEKYCLSNKSFRSCKSYE